MHKFRSIKLDEIINYTACPVCVCVEGGSLMVYAGGKKEASNQSPDSLIWINCISCRSCKPTFHYMVSRQHVRVKHQQRYQFKKIQMRNALGSYHTVAMTWVGLQLLRRGSYKQQAS